MTENPAITTLFLDIGGVLLTNGWDRGSRENAAAKYHLNFAEIEERHHLTYDTYEEGKLSLDEYLCRVIFYEERPFSQEDFKTYMYAQSQPYPGMIALMTRLKERYRLKIATVSNEGRELTAYRIDTYRLKSFIDFFVCSCFVHYRKPDADIYRIALDISQVQPGEVVYIDDREMFVEEAQKLGLYGICHKKVETTQAALAELGLR